MAGRQTVPIAVSLALVAALLAHFAAGASPDGFRSLAPGVLTVIPPDVSTDDTIQRGDILEITRNLKDSAWTPKRDAIGGTLVERAKDRIYPRDVWCLEFAYKPPRHIDIDLPAPDLTMRRKRVLYLLYRVKNTGGRRTTTPAGEPTALDRESFEKPVKFLPHFVLESVEGLAHPEGSVHYRGYLDRVIPEAIAPIRQREGVAGRLHDSASMVEADLAPGEERWGVAVWTDIDPRIDFFSIFVRGLTNAVRWRNDPDASVGPDDPPGAGTEHALESLRLDFWRHGDETAFEEEEVSIGHAGLLERMAIGVRVIEALGRPQLTKAQAREGLDQLGLSWRDLLVPAVPFEAVDRDVPHSLAPLVRVLERLAAIEAPEARGPIVRDLFGDHGIEQIEDLARALAEPAEGNRQATRAAALDRAGIAAADLADQPLKTLAKAVAAVDAIESNSARRAEAAALFSPAADRLDLLAKELSLARALVVIDDIGLDQRRLATGGPRAAFDALETVVDAEPDPAKRSRILLGLLGAEGPAIYATAKAVNEGIDHAWVFRYETEE
ncbi:MAG: hypothetical protein ACKOB1_11245 [Planctomycetia bacterium]